MLLSNVLEISITANLQPQHASRASYLRSYGQRLQGSLWSHFRLSSASSGEYFNPLFTAEKHVTAQYGREVFHPSAVLTPDGPGLDLSALATAD
jgi:hypothetical protein